MLSWLPLIASSFFGTHSHWLWYFCCLSRPLDWGFADSSVDSMFSGIVLLLFSGLHVLWSLACIITWFFIDSKPFPWKNILFLLDILFSETSLLLKVSGLHIIKWWCEINIHISIDDTDSLVLVDWLDLKDVDLELLAEDLNGDCVLLV